MKRLDATAAITITIATTIAIIKSMLIGAVVVGFVLELEVVVVVVETVDEEDEDEDDVVVVLVETGAWTVRLTVPELCVWLESPSYVAFSVGDPATEGWKVTKQDPETNVQTEAGVKVAFVSVELKLTFPVGELPATVAVQLVELPSSIVVEAQVTVVVVFTPGVEME